MLRTVHLHGRLSERFAPSYELDCASPAEAMRALLFQVPGFRDELKEGEYRICVVHPEKKTSIDFDEHMLLLDINDAPEIHLTPVIAGSDQRDKGTAKTIVGIVIMAVAYYFLGPAAGGLTAAVEGGTVLTSAGMVFAFGASVALSGVAMLLSPLPDAPKNKDGKDSFLFNGAENVYAQGGPVPLLYGRHMIGSVVVSAGIEVADIVVPSGGSYTDDTGYGILEGVEP